MTPDDIARIFAAEPTCISPDLDPAGIGPDAGLQDDLEPESLDVLNLVTALHHRLGIDIPEVDHPRIATLSRATGCLAERHAGRGRCAPVTPARG